MWFKNGLKAQKLLAQGSALGIMAMSNRSEEHTSELAY